MRIRSGHIRNLTGPSTRQWAAWGRQPNGASLGAKTRKVEIFEAKIGARSAPLCVNFTSVPLSCNFEPPALDQLQPDIK